MERKVHYLYFFLIALLGLMCQCRHSHEDKENHEDEHEHHEGEGVILEPHKAQEFGVLTDTVFPGRFTDVIKTSGTIETSGSDVFIVSAKKNGIISLVPGLTTGSTVKSGSKIGSISTTGVQGGDVPRAAYANLSALKAEYERLKPLYEDRIVTASTFKEAERAYREAEALAGKDDGSGAGSINAPTDGFLQTLYVKSGEYVDVGTPIAIIAKNTNQVLKADLPSREARHLPEIETANFIPEGNTSALKLKDLNGKKISENSFSNSVNGYIPVYFSFTGNPVSTPGGYAEVYLICGLRDNVISVPREALVEIQGNKYVYVSIDDHVYEKKLVKTGPSDGEKVEITDGLTPGDIVVTKGASIIRMAEVSAVAPPAHSHTH